MDNHRTLRIGGFRGGSLWVGAVVRLANDLLGIGFLWLVFLCLGDSVGAYLSTVPEEFRAHESKWTLAIFERVLALWVEGVFGG